MGDLTAVGHSVALQPIAADPTAWGVEEVWSEGPWRAYRVPPAAP